MSSVFELLTRNRFDPFTRELVSTRIWSEYHVIPTTSPYIFRLDEVPIEEYPSAVNVPGFTEVYTDPSSGQYRVDYNYATGYLQFNSANANEGVSVTYRGVGTLITAGKFNALLERDPLAAFGQGVHSFDWAGTHFSWAPSVPVNLDTVFTVSSTGPDGTHAGVFHKLTSVRTPSTSSTPWYSVVTVRGFKHTPGNEGRCAMQFRFRNASSSPGMGSFFAYFAEDPAFSDLLFDATSPTIVVTASNTIQTRYPGWSTLPVGFGRTLDGTFYFCTFIRSSPATGTASTSAFQEWTDVGGHQSTDDTSIPRTLTNTLGGHVSDVSSYFTAGATQWYDVRIELSHVEARMYVDGVLAAVHNTNIPNSAYSWGARPLYGTLQTCLRQSTAATFGYPSFEVDYLSVGPTAPVSPVAIDITIVDPV